MRYNQHEPYWASVPSNEIADEMIDKVNDYYEYLTFSGRLSLWMRSYVYYYRPLVNGGSLNAVGTQGELTAFTVNEYRNILLHLETMTIQQRLFFEPRAINSDVKSQSQAILAAGLLDYYMKEKDLENHIKQGVKDGLIFSEGFIRVEWDAKAGKVFGKTETGADITEGDIKYTNYNPLDVIRDFTKKAPGNDQWVILRDFTNKYDLAAIYPVLEDDILSDSYDDVMVRTTTINPRSIENSDNITVFTLIHEPTPSMPSGRYTQCLNNGTVLIDGPLPYDKTHVYRIAPDEETGTIFGYSVGFDLLAVQQAADICDSTIVTNQGTHGVQNVMIPKGADISVSQIAGGMNAIEYDSKIGKPESMQLTNTAPEIFNYRKDLTQYFQTISGVNSVARGNPEASLKSGAALALVQAQAIQFTMPLQQSYARFAGDIGTATIDILKVFASVPRVAVIAGKSNRPLMREFTGEDLDGIERVTIDLGNPLTRTTAGKVNLADSLFDKGLIKHAEQYIQVIATGRLDPVIEGEQAQLLLMKSENESLSEGKPVRALVIDDHPKHILEHQTVLANVDLRANPNDPIVASTLAHIQEHMDMWKTMDPTLFAALHPGSMAPPPQAPPMPPGATGDQLNPTSPAVQQAGEVNLPSMPKNALTGEQVPEPQPQ